MRRLDKRLNTKTDFFSTSDIATQAEQEAGTVTDKIVAPGRQHFHESAAKAWGNVTQSGGTYTLQSSYNVTSINKTATGTVTITIATDFSSANYAVVATVNEVGGYVTASSLAAGTFVIEIRTDAGVSAEAGFSFMCFGDHA